MGVEGSTVVAAPGPPIAPGGAVVAPHPPIDGYYRSAEEKRPFLTAIFDDTAADYDKVERWLSLGTGRYYRRQSLQRAGLHPGMHVLDVAVGTGLVAGEALKIVRGGGRVVGVDPSEGMLQRARERLKIETVVGTAEALPFASESFDFVSMGYALRHVDSLTGAFSEFRRVLKPGGRVCVLEVTRPVTAIGRWALRAYLGTLSRILGTVTRMSPRTPELWKYYWETIDQCVPPERVEQALRDAGFAAVERQVECGVFSQYMGERKG